jgi:hypothetical protein
VADVDFYLSIVDFWIAPMQLIDDVSQLFELHFSFLLQHQHTFRLRFRPCPEDKRWIVRMQGIH